jgi:hypothetical protein
LYRLRINLAQGTQTDEEWRVTKTGELIITRVVTTSSETMHERLVLEPSTRVLE